MSVAVITPVVSKKKTAIVIALGVWLVFTTGYVFYDWYQNTLITSLRTAYAEGRVGFADQLIVAAKECKAITVKGSKNETQVVGLECLKKDEG